MADQLKLGGKEVEFKPMTWAVQKQVFKLLTNGFAKLDAAQAAAGALVKGLAGGKDVSLAPMLELIGDMPELLTDVLSVGLSIPKEQLDGASGNEVMAALEIFIQENALDEQLSRAKKAFSLLRPQAKAAGLQGQSEAGS